MLLKITLFYHLNLPYFVLRLRNPQKMYFITCDSQNKSNYRPQRSCGKVMFSQVCVENSVDGGGGMQGKGGMHGRGCMAGGRGCAWQGVCVTEGVCDRGCVWQGVCMAGGQCEWRAGQHAWQGGMHDRGHVWQGACMVGACVAGGHTPQQNYEIRSMSGRYVSYWNAFLFVDESNFIICSQNEYHTGGIQIKLHG